MSTIERKPSHVQSVDRAISVLEFLSRNGLSGVTEIANLLDIHKSTAYRLVATLEARGLVEQDPETEKYQLGFGLVSLANAVTAELDILRHARPVCDRLSEETGETATITVLEGDEPVVVHQAMASNSVLNIDWIGSDTPIHCTAAGKIFLAWMPARRAKRILRRKLEPYTDRTITDPNALTEQLRWVREHGYAYTIDELEVGLYAIGAPIFAIDGSVVAVLSVSSPSVRLAPDDIPALGAHICQAADEISRKLGYHAGLQHDDAGDHNGVEPQPLHSPARK
jgi:DNA-binding IclR family transcriptional regulator